MVAGAAVLVAVRKVEVALPAERIDDGGLDGVAHVDSDPRRHR